MRRTVMKSCSSLTDRLSWELTSYRVTESCCPDNIFLHAGDTLAIVVDTSSGPNGFKYLGTGVSASLSLVPEPATLAPDAPGCRGGGGHCAWSAQDGCRFGLIGQFAVRLIWGREPHACRNPIHSAFAMHMLLVFTAGGSGTKRAFCNSARSMQLQCCAAKVAGRDKSKVFILGGMT